jgi:hypothetical protein
MTDLNGTALSLPQLSPPKAPTPTPQAPAPAPLVDFLNFTEEPATMAPVAPVQVRKPTRC